MHRAKLVLLIFAFAVASRPACAQFDVPPTPTQSQIQSAVSALSAAPAAAPAQGAAVATGGQAVTIYTGRTCPTLWEFLGVDKAKQGMKAAFGTARRIPLIQNFGNTVLHPVARAAQLMPAPAGGALGAETSPTSAGNTSAGGGAAAQGSDGGTVAQSGSPGAPGAPPPPPPAIPGGAQPPPPAPGPAALLAKIKAAKTASKAEIAAIRQLRRFDPREYPEIVASLLGKLESPLEEVRYEALLSLHHVARPRLCTRANSEECGCPTCQESWMRQSILSQPYVIDRLTDLLLRGSRHSPERIAGAVGSGAPKEYSPRIRRLALEMLEGSLRKPRIDGIRRAVPDPKYISDQATDAAQQQTASTRSENRSIPSRTVSRQRQVPTTNSFVRTSLPNPNRSRFEKMPRHILKKSEYAETVQTEPQRTIRKAAELFLQAGVRNSRDLDNEVIALCYEAIKTCRESGNQPAQLQLAFVLLTNSRLRLALDGNEEHIDTLTVDAEAFRNWSPESIAAKEATFSVVRYARTIAERYGAEDKRYLTQFAQQARHFADLYPNENSYVVPGLIAAAELCELNNLESEAAACFNVLETFVDNRLAQRALNAHRLRNPQSEPRQAFTQPASNDTKAIQPADYVREPGEPNRLQQIAFEQMEPLAPPVPLAPEFVEPILDHAPAAESYETDDRYAFERTTPSMQSFIAAMKAIDVSHEFEEVEGDCCLSAGFRNIATARSEYSLFAIEAARPANVFRIRFDSAKELQIPDRAEFFWAAIGRGGPPQPERSVNFQELRIYSEKSIGQSSAFVEIPFRMLDPEVNSNTTGLGDINMGAKTILLEDEAYTVSTVFRSYFNSGLDRRGLGRGHFVLEPGLLANYRLGCDTWLHGEMKFLMPLGAHPDAAGEALTFGAGFNHVFFAQPYHSGGNWNLGVIGSLEFQGISLLDGRGTLPDGTTRPTDETLLYLFPGIRLMLGENYDLGFSAAIPISDAQFYDRLFRTEFRVSF